MGNHIHIALVQVIRKKTDSCPSNLYSFDESDLLVKGLLFKKKNKHLFCVCLGDSGKVTTVVATPGQGPDRPQEVSYTDIKVIGNGSFGVVYQARLIDSQEMVAIKKVLQDKRFKVR